MNTPLADHLAAQRWFRGKGRAIAGATIDDVIPIGAGAAFAIATVTYRDDGDDTYALVVRPDDGERRDELGRPEVGAALLDAFVTERELRGARHLVRFHRTPALAAAMRDAAGSLATRPSGVEQSNTSIMYGDALVLKVVRRVEGGASLDVEMGAYLARAGFGGVPAVAGWIEMTPLDAAREGALSTLGTLHRFVPNQGDAWAFTLAELARARDPGSYRAHARRIGARTAEMHAALAAPTSDPAFAPEPFDRVEQGRLARAVRRTLDGACEGLASMLPSLDAGTRVSVDAVLRSRVAIDARLDRFAHASLAAPRTRVHGDLHLGQLLVTPDDDFVIVDFEGEPARPLAERRQKRSPIADVAGMLRSFHYASSTAGAPAAWHRATGSAFLDAYTAAMSGHGALADGAELALLVEFYVLEKAVYELGYEIANRPTWIGIPLAGLLDIVGA